MTPQSSTISPTFYTFLKASRNATGIIHLWKSAQYLVSDKDVFGIILCFLMGVHGQLAAEKLVMEEDNGRPAIDFFARVAQKSSRLMYSYDIYIDGRSHGGSEARCPVPAASNQNFIEA